MNGKTLDTVAIIEPNSLYKVADVERIIGSRYLLCLRDVGLRAVSDLYLGSDILHAHKKAAHKRYCQRVPERKEENNENREHKKMDNNGKQNENRRIHNISSPKKAKSLRDQLEEISG